MAMQLKLTLLFPEEEAQNLFPHEEDIHPHDVANTEAEVEVIMVAEDFPEEVHQDHTEEGLIQDHPPEVLQEALQRRDSDLLPQ